ncbi:MULTISPECIES: hypothetical protein [Glutamicibacter]|uniref:hypothetical protein n=1 Tax=Glutamicibacter TaxID=1742989 RepID=UPI003FCF57AD
MANKLPTVLIDDVDSLKSEELVLLYRDDEDYSKNIPDMGGVVRLISQSNPRVWRIRYRDAQTAGFRDELINLNNYETVLGVSGESDFFLGKR